MKGTEQEGRPPASRGKVEKTGPLDTMGPTEGSGLQQRREEKGRKGGDTLLLPRPLSGAGFSLLSISPDDGVCS